ncbi:SurA N-terminal domain-containing protein [Halobacillus seohaensis]|uniref:peptidylprolyl isomerase n=1 Tax=Halobacillus seohaensis TaxID=447421 RepID=A0ABW2EF77_9BACI
MTLNKKWLLSLSLAFLLSVTVACNDTDESAEDNNEETETQEEESEGSEGSEGNTEQPEMPEPDLEGIPEVVAEVNGEEIAAEEFKTTYEGQFQQMAMQSQMTGEEVDQDQLKKQIADSMVGQELLIQEATSRDIEVSEEEIDETLTGLAEENGVESKDKFLTALEEQGMGKEEVMSQVEMQVKLDQVIASEAGDIEPTEEELEKAYEQVKAQQEQMSEGNGESAEIPSFEEAKPDLVKQVKRKKEGEATQKLVEKLRADADVTVNL